MLEIISKVLIGIGYFILFGIIAFVIYALCVYAYYETKRQISEDKIINDPGSVQDNTKEIF